jgi:hypothetical protein
MQCFSLSELFTEDQPIDSISLSDATRSTYDFSGGQIIVDRFDMASCAFLRIKAGQSLKLVSQQSYSFQQSLAGGFLGTSATEKHQLWIVDLPKKRLINPDKSIQSEEPITLSGLSWDEKNGFSFELSGFEDTVIDLVIWNFDYSAAEEFVSSLPLESYGYFLWGSHGCVNKPADLYRHLIHGAIYDLRYSWPHKKKCFSENEAHALYTVFSGLEKTTGKTIYRYFQQQLVLSLIQRQSDDGGWYHGMWTDGSECHYRLHTSGVHLLMDEFQRTGCPRVKTALQKAVAFLSKTTDQLDCGTWFLHDSLELSEQAMNTGPFKWIADKTLGKSVSNMLVLNTHLDTTIALNRYGRITGDNQYQDLVVSALNSTRAVLALRTADWLYKPLFWAIGLTMLPTEKASQLPLPIRAIKRFAWQYLIKKMPDIKTRFPRLVMPNGYIDRELSLRTWAVAYQTINLMDLSRHAYSFPQAFDESILDKAMEFTQTSGLIKRYREFSPDNRYSAGFWSEALYYRCLTKPDMKYRQWLAEAMLECNDLGFGMAPSLLGSNGEAILPAEQYTLPIPDNKEILLANLSKANAIELLLVNSSNETVILLWKNSIKSTLKWFNSAGELVTFDNLTINQRDWIRGVANA